MKNNFIKPFAIGFVVAAMAVGIYFVVTKKDVPFKELDLSQDNIVVNSTPYPFYDTIVRVGLSELGIKDVDISIKPLSDKAKEDAASQGISLEAHLREFLGLYHLFMDESSRDQSIEIIAHELIHLQQYESNRLDYDSDTLTWNGEKFARTEIPYDERPWEVEASTKGKELAEKIREILYKKN